MVKPLKPHRATPKETLPVKTEGNFPPHVPREIDGFVKIQTPDPPRAKVSAFNLQTEIPRNLRGKLAQKQLVSDLGSFITRLDSVKTDRSAPEKTRFELLEDLQKSRDQLSQIKAKLEESKKPTGIMDYLRSLFSGKKDAEIQLLEQLHSESIRKIDDSIFRLKPLITTPMKEKYRVLDAENKVPYFDRSQQPHYEVSAEGGALKYRQSTFAPAENPFIYALSQSGRIFAAPDLAGYNHSSFLAGADVAAAGELLPNSAGKIEYISDESGHYLPKADLTMQGLRQLRQLDVLTDDAEIRFNQHGTFYAKDVLAKILPGATNEEIQAALAGLKKVKNPKVESFSFV